MLISNSFFELLQKSVSAVILSHIYNFWRPDTETALVPSGLRVATLVWVIVTGYIRQTSCVHTKTFSIFQLIKIQDRHIKRWRADEKVLRVSFFTSQPLHCGSFCNQQWLREIRPFAQNFQRKPSLRSKILGYHFHFWFNLGTSWILATAAQESIDLIGWWEDGLRILGTG